MGFTIKTNIKLKMSYKLNSAEREQFFTWFYHLKYYNVIDVEILHPTPENYFLVYILYNQDSDSEILTKLIIKFNLFENIIETRLNNIFTGHKDLYYKTLRTLKELFLTYTP